jgi:hypothetical protein
MGMRKQAAPIKYQPIDAQPDRATAGKLRRPSTAPTFTSAKAETPRPLAAGLVLPPLRALATLAPLEAGLPCGRQAGHDRQP